jgi:hypothetical protein
MLVEDAVDGGCVPSSSSSSVKKETCSEARHTLGRFADARSFASDRKAAARGQSGASLELTAGHRSLGSRQLEFKLHGD